MRVLIVEDDPRLGNTLAKGLREQAYAVDVAADGERALGLSALNSYDAIVLDVMLPRRDGLEVCRALRNRGSRVPVLMLTARDTVHDKITGLRALLRRGSELLPSVLTVGDLVVDTRSQTARRRDRALLLTAKEYALLEFLARHAGRVLSRAEICAHVWDENHDPWSNTLEVNINRLRRKLDADGAAPLIHTRRGAGYVLAQTGGADGA